VFRVECKDHGTVYFEVDRCLWCEIDELERDNMKLKARVGNLQGMINTRKKYVRHLDTCEIVKGILGRDGFWHDSDNCTCGLDKIIEEDDIIYTEEDQ
jgi:hypothetical protein